MGARRFWNPVAGLLVLGWLSPAAAVPPGPRDVRGTPSLDAALADMQAAENLVAAGRRELATLRARVRDFPVERRVVDADLFFEMGQYGKAAVLYRDLAENPEYRGHPGWARSLFQLGESLYRMGALFRAQEAFRTAAQVTPEPYRSRSLARVFEIAASEAGQEGVADLEDLARSPGASPELQYAYGKWLRMTGRQTEAATVLGRIPPDAPTFARAQYLLGVIAAARGDLLEAYGRFAASAAAPVHSDEDALVRGAAVLAQGRVLCSQDRVAECMSVLQGLDARSASFPEAIFELAWAHYKAGDLPGAVRSLDVLLMTSPDGELGMKARALRGRVLVRMRDRAGAEAAYQELTAQVQPIQEEMDRLLADQARLEAWLDFRMDRRDARKEGVSPLGEQAERWIQEDPELQDLIGMFEDLRAQRQEIQEGLEMARSLSWALRSGSRMEAFPSLKERYLQDREAEGRVLRSLRTALAFLRSTVLPGLPEAARATIEGGSRRGRDQEEEVDRLPVTREEFLARARTMSAELSALGQEVFLLESLLRVQRTQLQAILEWIRAQREEAGGAWSPDREARIQQEISRQRASLASLEKAVATLKETLVQEGVSVNSPEDLEAENRLRRQALDQALQEIRRWRTLGGLSPQDGQAVATVAALADRGQQALSAIAEVDGAVVGAASQASRELQGQVTRATSVLEAAAGAFEATGMEIASVSRTEVARALRMVRDRLGVALLEADLGLVEMAWQAAAEVEDRQQSLGKAYSERLRALDAVGKALKPLMPVTTPVAGEPARPAR
ncbi:MAG TPA: hypothetical protein PLQ97_04720 [Myxococcota bacterium]|nr:hypothetical protein [Myxococcota bacterium]HQK51073.1 hypothetical protein [Myxococcota bacterium]